MAAPAVKCRGHVSIPHAPEKKGALSYPACAPHGLSALLALLADECTRDTARLCAMARGLPILLLLALAASAAGQDVLLIHLNDNHARWACDRSEGRGFE